VTLAPAIYKTLNTQDEYDYLEKLDIPNPASQFTAGDSSDAYAKPYNSFSLVVEMPYYDEPRVNDLSMTTVTRRAALLEKLDKGDVFGDWMLTRLEKLSRI